MSLQEQIADLEDPAPRGLSTSCNSFSLGAKQSVFADLDPEDEGFGGQSSDQDSRSGPDESAAREHYLVVG
jgi:hypothetical protein